MKQHKTVFFVSSIKGSYLTLSIVSLGALLMVGIAGYLLASTMMTGNQQDFLLSQTRLVANTLAEEFQPGFAVSASGESAELLQSRLKKRAEGTSCRITVIDPEGKVLADSQADPSLMENHGARPEVMTALEGATGWSTRFSHTLNMDMLYCAIKTGGLVVRVATPLSHVQELQTAFLRVFPAVSIGAALTLLLVALVLYKRLMPPLERIRYMADTYRSGAVPQVPMIDHPRELETIARAMKGMADELRSTILQTRAQNSEMRLVLDSIHEAVLVLDSTQVIQRCNAAAVRLFYRHEPGFFFELDGEAQKEVTDETMALLRERAGGKHLLSFLRSTALADFLDHAFSRGEDQSAMVELPGGTHLKVRASPLLAAAGDARARYLVVLYSDDLPQAPAPRT